MDSRLLGGVDLNQFGFIGGQLDNSNISMIGHLDLPARIGKLYQDWAEQKSVEPYVDEEEIFFGGRDIRLMGYTKNQGQIGSLIDLADSFTDLVPYSCKWGAFNIKVGTISTVRLAKEMFRLEINMREPVVSIGTIIPDKDGASVGIDGISFQKLGGILLRVGGDVRNRPKSKQELFTTYGKEGYQITKTEAPILEIELAIKADNYADFKSKIDGLQALMAAPGTRLLKAPNLTLREFFVTEGFKVTNMYSADNYFFGVVTIKAIEVFDKQQSMGYITTNGGDYITDNYYNKLKGYGRY